MAERRYDDAIKYFQDALRINPCAPSHIFLAACYSRKGQTDRAINEMQQATLLMNAAGVSFGEHNRSKVQIFNSKILIKKGQMKQAREMLDKVISNEPFEGGVLLVRAAIKSSDGFVRFSSSRLI
ncbi:MAG: tetratricopeptide repeat protein [Candidatus Obscuribacterales bacterium]|nr:tetratricopeptide repeat protein [Candidatus Obscuribacterales bacterium]